MIILDIFLLRIARLILMGRNLGRSPYTSRQNNNAIWYMGEKLGAIVERIKDGYKNEA